MGSIIPPFPLIPFLQLAVFGYVLIIPFFWARSVIRCVRRCIYSPRFIRHAVSMAIFEILVAVVAPIGISIALWIFFWGQIIALYYFFFWYLIAKPLARMALWCFIPKVSALGVQAKAVYPLMWYDNLYTYYPLNGLHDIRLLVLYPADSIDDPLRCDIVGANLRHRPTYDALSYTWANEEGDTFLSSSIHCVRTDSKICVTKNCDAALRRLRDSKKRRSLWVDAICIDQASDIERSHQVSLMSDIYRNARNVFAYTGEGTPGTDLLYDWLNSVDVADLIVPSPGIFKDIDLKKVGILYPLAQIWNAPGGAKDVANIVAINFERYWRIASERFRSLIRGRDSANLNTIPEARLDELVTEYFSRRWFKRVWVLQEVSLPDLRRTRIICGSKTTTAERAIHLISLLKTQDSSSGAENWVSIFVLLRQRIPGPKTSHLLDILIETRNRECSDPRDKIFGVLSIARWMDEGRFSQLEARYEDDVLTVYWSYSAFFILQHGPGFFFALMNVKSRSPGRMPGLPSWAVDWTMPWLNYNAVRGVDFAARLRSACNRDTGGTVCEEKGNFVLNLLRPRILKGRFTRDGHLDDAKSTTIETVEALREGEVLVKMYSGLAALLKREEDGYYTFIQVCPYALSESGVEELIGRWSRVVVFMEGPQEDVIEVSLSTGTPEMFKIR